MYPTIQHMQRILRTLQDFGLSHEVIRFNESNLAYDELEVSVNSNWSTLYMITEQKDLHITLAELRTVNEIRENLESRKETTEILERILERVNYSKTDIIEREVLFHFDKRGLLSEITLDDVGKLDPEHFLGEDVLDALYPWNVKQLYEELKNRDYSTPEKTNAAIDRLIETALQLDITNAEPITREGNLINEILRIITETHGKNQDTEIKDVLKRLEARLSNSRDLSLVPEAEGLRQLYLQRMNEGRFLIFGHYGLKFPYVLASNAELDGCSGRVVDSGLYFVAEDAAPQLWQKEIIAYHEYVESRRGHAAAVRKEIGLARDLGVPTRTFYSWRNALRKR